MHDHSLPVADPGADSCPCELKDLPCGCQDVIYACGYIDFEHDHVGYGRGVDCGRGYVRPSFKPVTGQVTQADRLIASRATSGRIISSEIIPTFEEE
jgi:hypothetical protein